MANPIRKQNRTLVRLFSRRRDDWQGEPQLGILSRADFEKNLAIERARVDRSGYAFSVIVFSIQGATDEADILRAEQALSTALIERTRLCDTKGWYGDHLAAILPYTSKSRAAHLVKPIETIFRKNLVTEGLPVVPGPRLTFAIFGYPADSESNGAPSPPTYGKASAPRGESGR